MEQLKQREKQRKILTYEDAMRRIREATQVNNVQQLVARVDTQKETHQNLLAQVHTTYNYSSLDFIFFHLWPFIFKSDKIKFMTWGENSCSFI